MKKYEDDWFYKKALKKIKNNYPYKYYYNDSCSHDVLKKAIKCELNYRCNCMEGEKDLSNEATNKRFLYNLKRLRKEGFK